MITWRTHEARRYLLYRQGLLGAHRFTGKAGAYDYVRRCGCIQFDPVDVCGKNAELTLQSRVKGMTREMLQELLYKDRLLVDYPDKNQAIMPAEDLPCFARYRKAALEGGRQFEGLAQLEDIARAYMRENGPVSSDELPVHGRIRWHSFIHWSGNWHGESNAARSVLEQMYCTGECIIHHKKGARKYYDLADKYLPAGLLNAPDPYPEEDEHLKFRVFRRIGAVGLLWNRPSDAWLNIWGLDSEKRKRAFAALQEEGKILPVRVEGIRDELYIPAADAHLFEEAQAIQKGRCEVIAPLDPMMWDRKLIKKLFDFDYSWEIYTPESKRKYGYYVLPLIMDDGFFGRAEAVADEKADRLVVRHVWPEAGVKDTLQSRERIHGCMKRLARFNGCSEVVYE